MSTNRTANLSDSTSGKSSELPVLQGTLGAPVIDIGRLYKDTGCFTFDPGFVSTATRRGGSTASTAASAASIWAEMTAANGWPSYSASR